MVKVRILSGPKAGEVGEFAGARSLRAGIDVDPMETLSALVLRGEAWEVDWSAATSEEGFLWGRADLTARIMRAFMNGVSVEFNGHTFSGFSEVGVLEDAISESGFDVFVAVDDGQRLVIGHRGAGTPEQ